MEKQAFDIDVALQRIEEAVQPWPKAAMVQLSWEELDALISPSTFHERKAKQILGIARQVEESFDGSLPEERDVLLSFPGVGPKCANLVLGVACGTPVISVDIHVHRVIGRWAYVRASSPEKTLLALEAKLPKAHWIDINRLLVPFGKHICTGKRPRCSTCPVLDMCRQVGVVDPR